MAYRAVAVELSPLEGPPKAGLLLLEGHSRAELLLLADFQQDDSNFLPLPVDSAGAGEIFDIGGSDRD